MRYSKKREIIKSAVLANRIHPTAEEVYGLVHDDHPEISMGTVYRDLNQLSDSGELLKIPISDGADRFDGTVTPHQHIVCSICSVVEDFDYDIKLIEEAVENQTSMKCESCSINIKGLCCKCADKIDNK